MIHMTRSTAAALWSTKIETPHHHEVRLFPNYPSRPNLDPDHLMLQVRQRTTLAGQALRLNRATLAALWRWLPPCEDGPRQDTLVRAVVTGGRADVLVAAPGDAGAVGLILVHGANTSYSVGRPAVLDAGQAMALGAALREWLFAGTESVQPS
jgi:hypothetical protein